MISNVSSNPLHRAFCIRLYLFVYRFPMSDAVVTICHTPTLRLSFSYLTSDHFWLMSNNEYLHSQMSASPGPPPAQCCQWLRSPAPGLIGRVWRRPASSSASLRPPSRSRRLFSPGPGWLLSSPGLTDRVMGNLCINSSSSIHGPWSSTDLIPTSGGISDIAEMIPHLVILCHNHPQPAEHPTAWMQGRGNMLAKSQRILDRLHPVCQTKPPHIYDLSFLTSWVPRVLMWSLGFEF